MAKCDLANSRGYFVLGYFGSYARGDWSVGSDLDLLIIVDDSRLPFERRAIEWDVTNLSVPVDLLVYTAKEWQALIEREPFLQDCYRGNCVDL
jgi:predicted nucleotidyltransferase